LRWLLEEPATAATAVKAKRTFVPWAVAAVALVAAIVSAFFVMRSKPATAPLRLALPLDGELLATVMKRVIALSPDGRNLAYCAAKGADRSIFVRSLADGSVSAIAGTAGAEDIFWSPDSAQIAFTAGGKLMRVPIAAQEPTKICDIHPGALFSGDWGTDGTIVYAEVQAGPKFFRVPATGGEPQPTELKLSADSHVFWPLFLDEKRVAYLSLRANEALHLHIRDLASGDDRDTGTIGGRFELVGDTMLFVRNGSLYAQRTGRDLQRRGQPTLLAARVWNFATFGASVFTASPNAIVYVSPERNSRMTWFDLSGNTTAVGPIGITGPPHLSRDGKKAVVGVPDLQIGTSDLWACDLTRDSSTQLTATRIHEYLPVWSPDGRQVAYSAEVGGPPHVFTIPATGGDATEITPTGSIQYVEDWSPDGKWIAVTQLSPTTRHDLMLVEPRPHGRVVQWLGTPFNETNARFSPDSQWIAYSSDASGQMEIYVARVADPTERYQISTGGGRMPAWRADGREIFYMTADKKIYSVAIKSMAPFDTAPPQLRVQSSEGRWEGFDVSPDGQRFLVSRILSGPTTRPLNVIVNWQQLVPR
jgi:Tol biopolymer transport system component